MTTATALAAPAASRPFLAYLRFEVRRALRNRRYVVFTVIFPVLIYALYTVVIPAAGAGRMDGLDWPVYFLVSMAAYGAIGAAMNQAAPIAGERRGGWARQLRVSPLPGAGYVGAKLLTSVAIAVPALVLVGVAAKLLDHLALPASTLALLVVVLALGTLPFAALGGLIGYILDVESAQGGQVLALFTLAILGGLFAPLDAFPATLATIGRVTPSFHLGELGRAVAAGRTPDVGDVAVLAGWALGIGALAAWRYLADERARSA